MQRLAEIVKDNTVALVGNAKSIFGSGSGSAIDAHEVVIRMNAGLPDRNGMAIHVPDLGRRTTVWATAKFFGPLPADCLLMVFFKLTQLGDRDWARYDLRYPEAPMVRWPVEWERECRGFVGADPGTGIRLLWLLKTKLAPKQVSLFGIDCWATATHWSGRGPTPNHSPELERIAMAKLLEL
jgi:hypothetical protein